MTYRRNPGQQRARSELLTAGKRFCLIYGGSRCVSGDTILDGHTKTIRELAEAGDPVPVATSWGIQYADAPVYKGDCEMITIKTHGGREITVTPDHAFWNGFGWIQAIDLDRGSSVAVLSSSQTPPLSNSVASLSGSPAGDLRLMEISADYQGDCSDYRRRCDQRLHLSSEVYQAYRASQSDAPEHSRSRLPLSRPFCELLGSGSHRDRLSELFAGYIQTCLKWCHPSSLDGSPSTYPERLFEARAFVHICEQFQDSLRDGRLSLPQSSPWQSGGLEDHSDPDQCDRFFCPSFDTPFEEGYTIDNVLSVTQAPVQGYYTVQVPISEQYFANGFLNHNSGKTFELVGTILERALLSPGSRHLIVRQEAASAKRAIVKGTIPEVIKVRWKGMQAKWNEQYGYFTLPNGSEIWVGGLNDDKALEKILGNEYVTIYMNEASENKYQAFTLLRSRLAQTVETIKGKPLSQRFYVDLNPTTRQHWTYRLWVDGVEPESQAPVDMRDYGSIVVNPFDNADNLSQEYLNDLKALPERARRRFLEGKYVEDADDALWRRAIIRRVQNVPELVRIVVALDPAVTNEPGSDETGIIIAGVDFTGNAYILGDDSDRYSPDGWARRALAAMDAFGADRIVAEVNQGGDMVEHTIRAMRPNVPYRAVRASRNKVTRAEPVAALYERGKVFHVGEMQELEDQMCSFTVGFDRKAAGYSPDRVDALVWAITDLFPELAVPVADDDDFGYDSADHTRNEATGY